MVPDKVGRLRLARSTHRPAESYREAENLTRRRMFKPEIVNFTNAIARAKDNVDKGIFGIHLCEPVGESEFSPKSRLIKNFKDFFQITSTNNYIHILHA